MRQLAASILAALLIGCATSPSPPPVEGRVSMPEGFRPVPVTDLEADRWKPFRQLERGVRLLPKLHREFLSARPEVFVHSVSKDVILFAPVKVGAGTDHPLRVALLKRSLMEVFGAELKPSFLHSSSIIGRINHYAEKTITADEVAKLGCYAIGGDSGEAWFVGALWRPEGADPFLMDRLLKEIVGRLESAGP